MGKENSSATQKKHSRHNRSTHVDQTTTWWFQLHWWLVVLRVADRHVSPYPPKQYNPNKKTVSLPVRTQNLFFKDFFERRKKWGGNVEVALRESSAHNWNFHFRPDLSTQVQPHVLTWWSTWPHGVFCFWTWTLSFMVCVVSRNRFLEAIAVWRLSTLH